MPKFTPLRPMALTLPKPRNPLVAPAMQRHAGRHQSPSDAGAQRQQARLHLRRLLREHLPDESP